MSEPLKAYRQGEVYVIYKPVPAHLATHVPRMGKTEVVSRGSSTAHTHTLSKARLHKVSEHSFVGVLGKGAVLSTGASGRHEDIVLPAGEVEVRLQLEDDGGEAARIAAD